MNAIDKEEQRKQRLRERRERNRNLAIAISNFQNSKPDLADAKYFLFRADIALSTKLMVLDIAIEKGLVSERALARKHWQPTPKDFGLYDDQKPSPYPAKWRDFYDINHEKIVAGISILYILCLIFFFWKFGLVSGLVLFVLSPIILALIYLLINSIFCLIHPTYSKQIAAYSKYQESRERFEFLEKASYIKSLEKSVLTYQRASGPEFEQLVARAMRASGWDVTIMGGANDGGIDLECVRGSVRAIVQCKAHAKKISPAVVRELYGTLTSHPASLAILASTQGPSDNARLWAEGKPIRFITIDDLVEGRLE